MPARITINNVDLAIAQTANMNATVFSHLIELPNDALNPFVNQGAIVIQPNGLLVTPKVINDLLIGREYEILIRLSCLTRFIKRISTGKLCQQLSIYSITPTMNGVTFCIESVPQLLQYCIVIYRDNVPTSGGIFILQSCFFADPSLALQCVQIQNDIIMIPGATYYAAVFNKCQDGLSELSDYVEYSPCIIVATSEYRVDPIDGVHNVRVLTSAIPVGSGGPGSVTYVVQYKESGVWISNPITVVMQAGDTTSDWTTNGETPVSPVTILQTRIIQVISGFSNCTITY